VFENIIDQSAVLQLRDDILRGRNAPSMLFYGPPDSGKSSAALELARSLSCETDASWKCFCGACEKHRYLQHPDLLILGSVSSSAEISASCGAFLRNPSNPGSRALFIRSLRKLQIRFSPLLLEDDPKLSKISGVLQSLEEELSEFWTAAPAGCENPDTAKTGSIEKLADSLLKNAVKLENDGYSDIIPIGRLRRASWWCRLAPNGKRKTLLIENAECMRDEGRNSLLKLLEEPPPAVSIALTAQRREAIMPTILSRLRPYRFLKRSAQSERDVIRRVFQDSPEARLLNVKSSPEDACGDTAGGKSLVSAYLDSFISQNSENLRPLAAWFLVSFARITAFAAKKKGLILPASVSALGERYSHIAQSSGFERSLKIQDVVKILHEKSGNFGDNSFPRFLNLCLEMTASCAREAADLRFISLCDIFGKNVSEALNAAEILNQSTTLTLEALIFNLKTAALKMSSARQT